MKLTDFFTRKLVRLSLEASDKTQAITELIDLLEEQEAISTRSPLLEAVLERESQRTTGIGRGFAIPHAKCDAVSRLVMAFGRAPDGIDFQAVDGKPVKLIALLASPTNATSEHIQALAMLSRLVAKDNVLDQLLTVSTVDDFFKLIETHDTGER